LTTFAGEIPLGPRSDSTSPPGFPDIFHWFSLEMEGKWWESSSETSPGLLLRRFPHHKKNPYHFKWTPAAPGYRTMIAFQDPEGTMLRMD